VRDRMRMRCHKRHKRERRRGGAVPQKGSVCARPVAVNQGIGIGPMSLGTW
jgi:hypothetical protein